MWCFPRRRRSYLGCSREKKKLTARQKCGMVIACLLVFIIGVILYLNYVVNPVIIQMSEAKVRSLATKAVGSAIYEIVNQSDVYDDLIKITFDNDGKVRMIQTDAIAINFLNRSLTRLAQSNLEQIGNQGIDIPVGSFSGLPILVGRGPTVNIKLLPVGSISSSFSSEFTTAGINQTHHKIYVNLIANISIILPTANQVVQTSTQVLVCENIIIGEIPATYLQSSTLDEMLNLVP